MSKLTQLFQLLSKIENEVLISGRFSNEAKLIMVATIASLKIELTKSNPDPNTVGKSWRTVARVITIGGLLKWVQKANVYLLGGNEL